MGLFGRKGRASGQGPNSLTGTDTADENNPFSLKLTELEQLNEV